MAGIVKIWKLAAALLLCSSLAFGASGDTVIDGMPVETLAPNKVVRTNDSNVLSSTGVSTSELESLANGSNVDTLHTHTNASVTVTHASTTGQTTDDHHAKSHAHNGVDGSGTVAHSDLTGITSSNHHNPVTVTDTTTVDFTLVNQAISAVGLYVGGDAITLAGDGITFNFDGGSSPGGELGGTWASPTIDTVHSGSAHHDLVTLAGTLDYLTLLNQVITLGTVDVSDDTNLTAGTGITLTGDALSHTAGDPYSHIPTAGASAQLLQYSTSGVAKWITLSSDASVADGGAVTVANDSHAHTGTTLSGIDISDDTNLAVTAPVVLTDDTISLNLATPSNGDTTHVSTADQIYDWVIGLGYSTTVGTVTSVATTAPITGGTITNSGTIGITMEGDLVTTAPITGAVDNIFPGSGTKATLGITVAKDLVVSGTGMSGGEDNVFPGADADVNVTLTVAKDIVTTAPLTGGTDNVLPGSDSDITIAIPVATAIADGYLSSANWSTFNAKQPAGNYITALTGDVTASGPGSVAATIAANAVALGADTTGSYVQQGATSGTGLSGSVNTEAGTFTVTLATSKDIVAGNGLTGGENNVLPGADADTTLTLGTPSSLTSTSTNAVTTSSHTHAITNYTISGTANEVTVTGAGKVLGGAVTISLPDTIVAATIIYQETGDDPYSITDGTINGQQLVIVAADDTTSVTEAGSGNVTLAGGTAFDMDSGDTLTCVWTGSTWRETGRSFAF